jgi:hypothetical protein
VVFVRGFAPPRFRHPPRMLQPPPPRTRVPLRPAWDVGRFPG